MATVVHAGRIKFSELQAELAAGRQDRLVYYAFDLLWRNGDLRKRPQIERKQLLLSSRRKRYRAAPRSPLQRQACRAF